MEEVYSPIVASSLDAQAADQIRDLVLQGKLPLGSHLREVQLATNLGVSRGTVRAALRRLHHEGLVEYRPNRGIFIRQISSNDLWEIYTLRDTLEGMASRLAASHITANGKRRLKRILKQMEAAAAVRNREAAMALDFDLHQAIVELSGHRHLMQAYGILQGQIRLFMALTDMMHVDLSHMVRIHQPLVDAITSGDADQASSLACTHNIKDGEQIVRLMQKKKLS
jgi:DNA-binding GntR family transcriptional regulator